MIGLGYSNVFSFNPTEADFIDEVVVPGRVALTSISIHSQGITTAFTIDPLVFKNGTTSGDIRYKVAPWAYMNYLTLGGHHQSQQVFMGGAGILFEDGIHFEWGNEVENDMGVDNVVLFYVGPPGLVP